MMKLRIPDQDEEQGSQTFGISIYSKSKLQLNIYLNFKASEKFRREDHFSKDRSGFIFRVKQAKKKRTNFAPFKPALTS